MVSLSNHDQKGGFMRIHRPWAAVIIGTTAVILGVVAIPAIRHHGHAVHEQKGVYYCPMHPTYTSDHPGDCPICNMRLVKREMGPTTPVPKKGQSLEDICILHNCPKLHEGRPCPMMVVAKAGEKVICPVCGTHVAEAAQERKILYWTDPMMPGYQSDKPGKSPMGMDLIPVYEEASGESGGTQATSPTLSSRDVPRSGASPTGYAPVLVTPQKQQWIGVKTAPVQKRRMIKTIRTVGIVKVDETRRVHIHPKVEGWVGEIYAKYEGDAVKRGQPLFSFYSPDFVTTQQEYLATLKTLKEIPTDASSNVRAAAQNNAAASRQRLLWWDVTEEQIQELEKRASPAKTLLLTSPIDGVVLAKHIFPGEYMPRGGDFYHLVDLSAVWVDADLYEYDLPLVTVGQEATVVLPNDAEHPLRGKVMYVSPIVQPETRTATARLELPNPKGILKPGMYTNTQITVDLGMRLAVPTEAILDTGIRQIVFVDRGQGLFEPRDVTVGVKADGTYEIKSGVNEGEVVVVSGNFLIDSESRLKGALEGMEGTEHQHAH